MPVPTPNAAVSAVHSAINKLRYTEDEAGNVRIAGAELLQQSEALSQFVREGGNGGGLGIYLPLFGKLETEKIARVGSFLSASFFFLTKWIAPTEEAMDLEMQELRRGQLGLAAQVAALHASCAGGGGG